jgi:hypothetical protein
MGSEPCANEECHGWCVPHECPIHVPAANATFDERLPWIRHAVAAGEYDGPEGCSDLGPVVAAYDQLRAENEDLRATQESHQTAWVSKHERFRILEDELRKLRVENARLLDSIAELQRERCMQPGLAFEVSELRAENARLKENLMSYWKQCGAVAHDAEFARMLAENTRLRGAAEWAEGYWRRTGFAWAADKMRDALEGKGT